MSVEQYINGLVDIKGPVPNETERLALNTPAGTYVEQNDVPNVIFFQTGADASDSASWRAFPASKEADGSFVFTKESDLITYLSAQNIVFDPFTRRVDVLNDFDGRDRWFGSATSIALITGDTDNPYGTRTFRHLSGSASTIFGGKKVYLSDAGIRVGDTVSFAAYIRRASGPTRMRLAAYNSGFVSYINTGPEVISDGEIVKLTASGVVPAETEYIAVIIDNRAVEDPIDIYAIWGAIGDSVSPEPVDSDPNGTFYGSEDVFDFTQLVVSPSGGDYTTVSAALAAITDASIDNRYRILIEPGIYTEPGANSDGLELKDYVDLVGVGKDLVTLKGPGGTLTAPIHIPADCTVSGMTLRAVPGDKYAIHADSLGFRDFVARDLRLIHEEADEFALGIGARTDQSILFEGLEILGDVFVHSPFSNRTGGASDTWDIVFRACSMDSFLWRSLIEYTPARLLLDGCEIVNELAFSVSLTYYNSNSGDPLYNRGFTADAISLVVSGTHAGSLEMLAGWEDIMDVPPAFPNVSERVYNSGGSAIGKGEAMKLLVDTSGDLTGDEMRSSIVAPWDGSGIYYGVAVEEIAATSRGAAQRGNRPKVSADGATAISRGDALEVNSSGVFVKLSGGILRGYALEDLASGTGIISMIKE